MHAGLCRCCIGKLKHALGRAAKNGHKDELAEFHQASGGDGSAKAPEAAAARPLPSTAGLAQSASVLCYPRSEVCTERRRHSLHFRCHSLAQADAFACAAAVVEVADVAGRIPAGHNLPPYSAVQFAGMKLFPDFSEFKPPKRPTTVCAQCSVPHGAPTGPCLARPAQPCPAQPCPALPSTLCPADANTRPGCHPTVAGAPTMSS